MVENLISTSHMMQLAWVTYSLWPRQDRKITYLVQCRVHRLIACPCSGQVTVETATLPAVKRQPHGAVTPT